MYGVKPAMTLQIIQSSITTYSVINFTWRVCICFQIVQS